MKRRAVSATTELFVDEVIDKIQEYLMTSGGEYGHRRHEVSFTQWQAS